MTSSSSFNAAERRGSVSLALLFALRMAGLFMLMPVLATYGDHLAGYSPLWIGIAIGSYGFTQAMMQVPMGMLSDRIGRKPVIIAGLALFALGSVIAAMSNSLYGVALGRALQGLGAIASAVMALAADLSREEQRAKVMAVIGVSIGLSFAVSLVLGPVLSAYVGLSGIFWLTALLAILGMGVVKWGVPDVTTHAPKSEVTASRGKMRELLKEPQLLRLNWGVFCLHLAVSALFISFPLRLLEADVAAASHWKVYLPTVLISFVLMIPLLIMAAKRRQQRGFFLFSIGLMLLSQLGLLFSPSLWGLALVLVLFFVGFNYMEASMPALLSMLSPPGYKGSALGIYSTTQFAGAFVGGGLGGWVSQYWGADSVPLLCIGLFGLWVLVAWGMKSPSGVKSYTLSLDNAQPEAEVLANLRKLPGVLEAIIISQERTAYLKVNSQVFDLQQAQALVK